MGVVERYEYNNKTIIMKPVSGVAWYFAANTNSFNFFCYQNNLTQSIKVLNCTLFHMCVTFRARFVIKKNCQLKKFMVIIPPFRMPPGAMAPNGIHMNDTIMKL